MSVERAFTKLFLLSIIDALKLLEEVGVGRFSLAAGVAHLGQLLDEFADTLADLERAALFESGTVAGEAFALGNKNSVRAHCFAERWTL